MYNLPKAQAYQDYVAAMALEDIAIDRVVKLQEQYETARNAMYAAQEAVDKAYSVFESL